MIERVDEMIEGVDEVMERVDETVLCKTNRIAAHIWTRAYM